MGRVPFPGPYFSSAIEATIAARRLGALELLEGLADGSKRGTIALDELGHGDPVDRIRTRARRKGADWVLTGLKPLVLDGHTADWVIVAARTQEGIGSFLIESPDGGARADDGPHPQGRAARARRDVRRSRSARSATTRRSGAGSPTTRRSVSRAELVGVCEAALEMAVEYSKVRVQFDKPIATHQVIQHKIVDMLHKLELGRVGVHFAAWASDVDDEHRSRAAAIAKSSMAEGAVFVTAENIQVHGAVGFTWDSRRAVLLQAGEAERHAARLPGLAAPAHRRPRPRRLTRPYVLGTLKRTRAA